MSVIIKSGSSGATADVDSNNNLQVNLPTLPASAGYVRLSGGDGLPVTTSGSFSGSPLAGAGKNRLKVGVDSPSLYDPIDGTTVNENIWSIGLTTTNFTVAQSTSALTLNSAASVTASSGCILFSNKQFQRITSFPLVARWTAKIPNQNMTNATIEMGFGNYATMSTSATATVTDGAYFRFNTSGCFAVTDYNTAETNVSITAPSNSAYHTFMIVRKATGIDFYIDDTFIETINASPANPAVSSTSRLNLFFRCFTSSSAASAAPQINLGEIVVFQEDLDNNKTWQDQMAGLQRHCIQSPSVWTQTSNWANSTSPTSATLSNTAAGYATLGGRYQFAAIAGAATDYCLFGYQIPAGFDLYITSINISSIVTGAAVATTATILDWGVAVNSSAVSLATAETAAGNGTAQAFSPRRLSLGIQGFIVGAAIGATSSTISQLFPTPLVCNSGRFVQIILQMPVGTATASQIFRGDVTVCGYFE